MYSSSLLSKGRQPGLAPRRSMWAAVVAVLALFGFGCATPQAFVPLAELRSVAPDGKHGAADYRLEPNAHVQVWTRGTYRDESQSSEPTVVHIGFVLENRGTAPMRLDQRRLFLEDIGSNEGSIQQLAPTRVEGNTAIAPSGKGQVDAYFTLPRRVWPSDVYGYRVAWALEGGERASVQRTAFESTRFGARLYVADSYYPYYPWGWYYPWRPYPYPWRPYPYYYYGPYWQGPRVYVPPPVYLGPPRVLARPRAR